MGEVLMSKLSEELAEINNELVKINEEISKLRKRKNEFEQKKIMITKKIESESEKDDGEILEKWDRDGFEWSSEAEKILKEKFHLDSFRPLQRAAINATMSKEDCLVIMSTGGGKSLCYQLPALLSKGLTLVISPLISLVDDQIHQLTKLEIEAGSLNASTSKEEVKRIEEGIVNKNSKFRLLYVTPEKLAKSKRMMNKLEKSLAMGILKLIAIDEIHCCSHWGHDFRTDYGFLNILKRQFKGIPIIGLTATATATVIDDVKTMLGIQGALVFRAGFNRTNLKYEVLTKSSNEEQCVEDIVKLIKDKFKEQTGIIYCLSRNDCEKMAKAIKNHGIKAKHYHAYMESDERKSCHESWLSGKVQVIVATVAFGMGIDKPDVRFVIHHSIPKSVENYYQESGRAGRDGKPASCILFYRLADVFKQSTMVQHERTGISNLYVMLEYATDETTCRRVRLAQHFEEAWDPTWCQKGCDVCQNVINDGEIIVDVSDEVAMTVKIINDCAESTKEGSGKITGNKLVEMMAKKLKSKSREYCESLIAFLLINGYLQESFHYTVYSVISYVVVGFKWNVYDGKSGIMMKQRQIVKNRKRKIENI